MDVGALSFEGKVDCSSFVYIKNIYFHIHIFSPRKAILICIWDNSIRCLGLFFFFWFPLPTQGLNDIFKFCD